MERLSEQYPLTLLLVTHHDSTRWERRPEFLLLQDEPTTEKLYVSPRM
jgi:hypothetical protein